jgi:hypothetical protein
LLSSEVCGSCFREPSRQAKSFSTDKSGDEHGRDEEWRTPAWLSLLQARIYRGYRLRYG